jgi:hypothetical protein|tara:strand:+ start:104 stop:538 length:435 start_codon:yes stop_codon:yes gene_type:complete
MNDKIKVIYLSKRNRTFNYNKRLKGNFLAEKHKNFKININKAIEYPKYKGIYFCIDRKTHKIVYIGESINILSRLASNPVWKPKQMKLRFMKCKDKNRLWYERRWICKFVPKYNTIPNIERNYLHNPFFKKHLDIIKKGFSDAG